MKWFLVISGWRPPKEGQWESNVSQFLTELVGGYYYFLSNSGTPPDAFSVVILTTQPCVSLGHSICGCHLITTEKPQVMINLNSQVLTVLLG